MFNQIHRKITREAVRQELPELFKRELRMIEHGNTAVNYRSWLRYKRQYHVDRIPFSPHADAWEIGQMVLKERWLRIAQAMSAKKRRRAYKQIGALLHTVQDFFSHTNYHFMNTDEQAGFINSLTEGLDMPDTTMICSVYPRYTIRRLNDGYSHKEYHKDSGEGVVFEGALRASRIMLRKIRPMLFAEY
ncbi:MAG: hypothetical protein KAQ69_12510 [Spirochaetales bacterium]|nr:hypothetical protein [Spirochaetales bacterium]